MVFGTVGNARRLGLTGFALAALAASLDPAAASPGFSDLSSLVFVASRASPEIAVIDSRVDRVIGHVVLPAVPHQFVLSDKTGRLIATHLAPRAVSVVDLRSLETRVLPLEGRPDGLQISPDGDLVAIASRIEGAIVLLALHGEPSMRRIGGLPEPGAAIFDRRGQTLFVASRATGQLMVIDVAGARMVGRIDLTATAAAAGASSGISALARTPGGELGFALHGASGLVSVVDLRRRRPVGTIRLPGPASQAFPTADSQYLLVPNERDGSVSLISTWSLKESARLPGARGVSGINTGMFDTIAVVISRDHDEAVLLDLLARRRLGEIPLRSHPETAVAAAGLKLYVALSGSDQLAVIGLQARRLIGTIDGVGHRPWAVNMANALSYCH